MSSYMIADPVASVAMSRASSIINHFNKLLSAEKKGLDEIQKDKGGKYIEKIVQVPIKLPKVSQENLKDIFIKKLKTIHIKHEALDKDEFIKKIKENNFADAFKSIRDMERFLNAFKIEVNAINQELYLYDFTVITLLKIFEPRLYDYIYDNRMLFIEQYNPYDHISSEIKIPENIEQEIKKLLNQIRILLLI